MKRQLEEFYSADDDNGSEMIDKWSSLKIASKIMWRPYRKYRTHIWDDDDRSCPDKCNSRLSGDLGDEEEDFNDDDSSSSGFCPYRCTCCLANSDDAKELNEG